MALVDPFLDYDVLTIWYFDISGFPLGRLLKERLFA